jgi:hypothetical protein
MLTLSLKDFFNNALGLELEPSARRRHRLHFPFLHSFLPLLPLLFSFVFSFAFYLVFRLVFCFVLNFERTSTLLFHWCQLNRALIRFASLEANKLV